MFHNASIDIHAINQMDDKVLIDAQRTVRTTRSRMSGAFTSLIAGSGAADAKSSKHCFRKRAREFFFGHQQDDSVTLVNIHGETATIGSTRKVGSMLLFNSSTKQNNTQEHTIEVVANEQEDHLQNFASELEVRQDNNTLRFKNKTIDPLEVVIDSKTKLRKKHVPHFDVYEKRVVTLDGIPKNAGLSSVLTQICGGPLEKFQVVYDSENHIQSIFVHFLTAPAAAQFIKFGSSGTLKINGFSIMPTWASSSVNQESNYEFEEIFEEYQRSQARRCLVLKKHFTKKVSRDIHKQQPYSSPKLQLSELNIKHIKQDFQPFGEIAEIMPMVSRKLCVCICFNDIRSAIAAKAAYDNQRSNLHKIYYSEWSLWFGKDPSDKPALLL